VAKGKISKLIKEKESSGGSELVKRRGWGGLGVAAKGKLGAQTEQSDEKKSRRLTGGEM